MSTPREETRPMDELRDIRKTLQEAGITLLAAATAAVSAAAKDTMVATKAVIAAADDTLAAAEEKVKKVRAELRKKA